MTIVNNIIIDESSDPIANVYVEVRLIAFLDQNLESRTSTFAGDVQVLSRVTTRSDFNGAWSLDLIANEDITPANSFYRVIERVHGNVDQELTFVVPTGGPQNLVDLLVEVPPDLPVGASLVAFDPQDSGMEATNVEDAILEAFLNGHGGGGGPSGLPRLRTTIASGHTADTFTSGVSEPAVMEVYDSDEADGVFHLSDDGTTIVIDQDGNYAFMVNVFLLATAPVEFPIGFVRHLRGVDIENDTFMLGILSPDEPNFGIVAGTFTDRFLAGDTFQLLANVLVSAGTWTFNDQPVPLVTAIRMSGDGGSGGGLTTILAGDEDITVEAFNGTTVVLYNALTAARTVMLPPASGPSQIVIVKDVHGLATNNNTIDVVPADGDGTDGWDPIGSVVPPFNPGIALSVTNDGGFSWSQVGDQSPTLAYVASISTEVTDNLNSLIETLGDNLVHTVNGQENDVALEPIPHANIALWFDASATAFYEGGIVTERSANHRNFNGNPGTDTLNDLPVWVFDGAHPFIPMDPPSDFATLHYDATTIFIVTKYQHGGSGTYFGDLTGTSPGIAFVTDDVGLRAAVRGAGSNDVIDGRLFFDADTWQLVTVKLDPQNATAANRVAMFLNGIDALVAPNIGNNGAVPDDAGTFQIGNQPLGPGLNGSIAEILIYNGTLTGTQQRKVEAYLREKWLPVVSLVVPGTPVVRKFPFTFDTPDLLTGAALYIPTPDDILLDAWIEVGTAWDATAFGDVGSFIDNHGWYYTTMGGELTAGVDLTAADMDTFFGAQGLSMNSVTARNRALAAQNISNIESSFRVAPGRFTTTDPIRVVVSSDGSATGSDPGATQGSAVLYLITVTPVT